MNKKQLKIVTGVAIAVLIISIIPMLWISQYLHPFADDYVFGAEVYKIWKLEPIHFRLAFNSLECSYDDVSYMAGHVSRLLSPRLYNQEYSANIGWNIYLYFQFGDLHLHFIIYGYAQIYSIRPDWNISSYLPSSILMTIQFNTVILRCILLV